MSPLSTGLYQYNSDYTMKTFGIIYAAHLLVNYATVVHSRAASTTCVDSTNSELYLHDGVPLVTG